MRPIFLIGFMCSGKTTLGRALAKAASLRFIDLDEFIEQEAQLTVREIFEQHGEAAFRALEADALRRIASTNDVVVACGGGTPCQPGAMQLMNECGTTVWLVPQRQRLVERLLAGRRKRPLLANIDSREKMCEFVDDLTAKRSPHYSKAKFTFDSSMLESSGEIAFSVEEFMRQFLS